MKAYPIKTNTETFFRQYLELINPMMGLRKKEMDVLSQLLYYNHKHKELDEYIRMKMIFDQDTKVKIRGKLDISEASLNNNLTELRKRGIITKKNSIASHFLIHPEDKFELTFKFELNGQT